MISVLEGYDLFVPSSMTVGIIPQAEFEQRVALKKPAHQGYTMTYNDNTDM